MILAQRVSRSVTKRRSNVVYGVVVWSSPVRWRRMPGIKWYKRGQVPYIRALESLYFLPFLPLLPWLRKKAGRRRETCTVVGKKGKRNDCAVRSDCERVWRTRFGWIEGRGDSVPFSPRPPPPLLSRVHPPKNKRINRRFFMQTCI